MKKLAMLLLGLALLAPGAGFCAEKVAGVVVFVQGDAALMKSGAGAPVPLELNTTLSPGDSIKTGPGAKASVVSKTGAEIRINENSVFEVPKDKNIFNLSLGQVWSRMLHKKAKLSVRTPSAVCAIRGTEADIEQKEILTVKVYEGHVELKNKGGIQQLKAGQLSTVAGAGAAPAAPRLLGKNEMGTWQQSIEVKDVGRYLQQMGLDPAGNKDLQLTIGENGKTRNIKIKLKKK